MTAPAATWQLDRLSTSAREAAEIASLGAGLSLSSWLARLIGETCAAEGVAPPSEPPKILEFTREIRDRAQPVPPRIPSAAAMPASVAPASVMSAAPPSIEPAAYAAPQPAPVPPPAFRPVPVPTAVASPAPISAPTPTATVTSIGTPRPQTPPPILAPAMPILAPPPVAAAMPHPVPSGASMLPVAAIVAANLGTRRGEDLPEALLSDIATRGVRQPITVRRSAGDPEQYEIVCGHRRWRAAQRVGLAQLPAIIVAPDDASAILASLTENLQQGTLSAIDEAQAYLRLLTQCAIDASAVTAAVGRDRKHIVQSMRLLGLPPLVRHLVGSGMLSREHAYLLLDAPNPEALADA
ncbi:MAG TPA: ParB/RepB/Spo0J family partition protein, partial [Stellaceae bacterium]|nr:ParB/RepB/Spo0J family partition protein [Stellaceae bacterium]